MAWEKAMESYWATTMFAHVVPSQLSRIEFISADCTVARDVFSARQRLEWFALH